MTAGEFWTWFVENEGRFREVVFEKEDPRLAELLGKLKEYNEKLGFGISPTSDGPPRVLLISADGCEMHFPSVDALVEAAPAVVGWTFMALKPAKGFGFVLKDGDVSYAPEAMSFETIEDIDGQGRLGLKIYVPGLAEEQIVGAIPAVWEVLETGLGERVCWSMLGGIELVPDDEGVGRRDHLPLTNLPTLLEWRKRGLKVAGES